MRRSEAWLAKLVMTLHDALDAGVARVAPVSKNIVDDLHSSRLSWLSAKTFSTHAARLQVARNALLRQAALHAAALCLCYPTGMRQRIARIKADVLAKGVVSRCPPFHAVRRDSADDGGRRQRPLGTPAR